MRNKILIGCVWCCLFSLFARGAGKVVVNPYTHQEIAADSIIEHVMDHVSIYEDIVSEYRANLYIKGKLDIQKKNVIFRYIPSMFRMQKGVREYLLETCSDLHYTAPNIYDQKVRAYQGTVRGDKSIPGLLRYFNINIYSSSLLTDRRLLSPMAKNAGKYYTYEVDSVMEELDRVDYRIRFTPKLTSDQLVSGYMIVSSDVWSVRRIYLSGRSEMMTFSCDIEMGDVGSNEEFVPVRYDVDVIFNFLGNKIKGDCTASLNYTSVEMKEEKIRKRGSKYNLSDSFSLQCDTNAYKTDASTFAILRHIPLNDEEKKLYQEYDARQDTMLMQKKSKSQVFLGTMGDLMLEDYKFDWANVGSVRCAPFINPLLLSYSGSNGWSYRHEFRYNRLFRGGKQLRIVPKIGYNFTRKEFYWLINSGFEYYPQRRGTVSFDVGNGNRIYSYHILNELEAREIPDSIFPFKLRHLGYFKDLYFNFSHSIEIVNGLSLSVGVSAHKMSAVKSSYLPELGFKNTYVSFAPRFRVEWTPCLYYYMNGKRKINLGSSYPTFSFDYERAIKGAFNSTGEYEKMEFDLQHQIQLGLIRSIFYRFGFGMFTNRNELYFANFSNFTHHNLPVGWNDEIGGTFQLLSSRQYNASHYYVRGHFTYEAPFLLLKHLMKYTHYVQSERIYFSILTMSHLNPYMEAGYGIGTHVFDVGIFVSSENKKFSRVGCKFTFELFDH